MQLRRLYQTHLYSLESLYQPSSAAVGALQTTQKTNRQIDQPPRNFGKASTALMYMQKTL